MGILKHRGGGGTIWVGLDVHKETIAAAVLRPGDMAPRVQTVSAEPAAVRRLVDVVSGKQPDRLRVCYEAGPTGSELHRQLTGWGAHCEVIASSLIPKAPGDKVKTDRRDAARLVRLFQAGQLVAIRVPSPTEEAVRDLCRAREDLVDDVRRAKNRLGKFLLRHGQVYPGRSAWTVAYRSWLTGLHWDEPALRETFAHYRAVVDEREATVRALESDLLPWAERAPFADQVARLVCYRGIDTIAALTFATEVCDWRRFPTAPGFMAFTGLIPSEYSSGGSTHRGRITHTGNAHVRTQLVESAWHYRYPARIGTTLIRRQAGKPVDTVARSWAAQQRLCSRFHRLSERKHVRTVVVTAVARELAGFLWAEMTAEPRAAA